MAGILENALAAQDFIAGMDLAAFQADRRTHYAATRSLEIISEASRRVDDDVRLRYPHIPWRQVAEAGNVCRHRYKSVTVEMVWLVARERMSASSRCVGQNWNLPIRSRNSVATALPP